VRDGIEDDALQPRGKRKRQQPCAHQDGANDPGEAPDARVEFLEVRFEIDRADFDSVELHGFEQNQPSRLEPHAIGPHRGHGRRRLGRAAVAGQGTVPGRIHIGGYDVALGAQRGENLPGHLRVVKAQGRGAIGAQHLRQHLEVVPHGVACRDAVVCQNRRAGA